MKTRLYLLLLALSWAAPAWPYNEWVTHRDLSRRAFDKSKLNTDPELIANLGLTEAAARGPWRFTIEDSSCTPDKELPLVLNGFLMPRESLARGAIIEDATIRSFNHFYDPHWERPLTVEVALGKTSPTWILEDTEETWWQEDSFRDARQSMYLALTTPGPNSVRDALWSNTFQRLGHVIHHIQDMAQPQHVRNDQHLPPLWSSLYEEYSREVCHHVRDLASSSAVLPGGSEFKTPRDFWKNPSGTGLAEFTNKNFVSKGTNFAIRSGQVVTVEYPSPQPGSPTDYTLDELYAEQGIQVPTHIRFLCSDAGFLCKMTMYPTPLVAKASTLSIFDQDLEARNLFVIYRDGENTPLYQTDRLFALNRFNFHDAQAVLIPKAVGYSAGLINYFFRGKLEVTLPAIGAYAVADHSTGQGFTTIKATVKNVTPDEAMSGGKVVAVVKFHRNQCYKPDLTGEFTQDDAGILIPPPCERGQSYRSTEEFIVKSAEQDLSLASGAAQELTFSLSDPLPFDATDVFLQVIYRGELGDETGAIAVGTADISEPTFMAIFNATDIFAMPDGSPRGGFFYYTDIIKRENIVQPPYSIVDLNRNQEYDSPPDVEVRGGEMYFELSLDGGKIAYILALPEGRFSRMALLVDPDAYYNLRMFASGASFNSAYDQQERPKISQVDWPSYTYFVSPVHQARKQTNQWAGSIFYRYYITPWPDFANILPSRVTSASEPFPLFPAL